MLPRVNFAEAENDPFELQRGGKRELEIMYSLMGRDRSRVACPFISTDEGLTVQARCLLKRSTTLWGAVSPKNRLRFCFQCALAVMLVNIERTSLCSRTRRTFGVIDRGGDTTSMQDASEHKAAKSSTNNRNWISHCCAPDGRKIDASPSVGCPRMPGKLRSPSVARAGLPAPGP